MDLDVEKLISPNLVDAVRRAGLHKIAGAMAGVDEITIKEAVKILGGKAYIRRKQAGLIATGLAAFASLRGEKIANFQELLTRSFRPALAGAAIATVPDLLQDGPVNVDKALQHALVGGALGGVGGMARNVQLAARNDPAAWSRLMESMPQR
jgi:hypothetical protein